MYAQSYIKKDNNLEAYQTEKMQSSQTTTHHGE